MERRDLRTPRDQVARVSSPGELPIMALFASLRPVAIVLSISLTIGHASAARADLPDRQVLRDRLKVLWDSLASVEVKCEEFVPDSRGRRDFTRPHLSFHFCHKQENGWFCDARNVFADGGRRWIDQTRQDGLKQGQIRTFDHFPDEISDVTIQNQESTPLEYTGIKFSALWLFLPGGKPVHVYLDEGATFGKARVDGRSFVAIDAVHRGMPLRLILDGEHDWLPRRIELGRDEDTYLYIATNYSFDNGRWFPTEGQYTQTMAPGRPVQMSFVVTQLRMNRPFDDALFRLPPIPDGVRISDQASGEVRFQGGDEAYLKRQAKFHSMTKLEGSKSAAPTASRPIVAGPKPVESPWVMVVILSSGILLIAAGLRWRGR